MFPRTVKRLLVTLGVTAGFLVSASGMALLARLALDSTYVAHIMPGMILLGLGIGAVMTTAFQGATAGVHHEDTGVAPALINTSQQVGGSISTALLTTIEASSSRPSFSTPPATAPARTAMRRTSACCNSTRGSLRSSSRMFERGARNTPGGQPTW